MEQLAISGVRKAVDEDPSNVELRAHLANLLHGEGRHAEAWAHSVAGLDVEPANLSLLRVAIHSGAQTGHEFEVNHYANVYRALANSSGPPQLRSKAGRETPAPARSKQKPISDSPNSSTKRKSRANRLRSTEPRPADRASLPNGTETRARRALGRWLPDPVTFADVGGMSDVKAHLHSSLLSPKAEDRPSFKRRSMLLWGPPGCSKTFLARAVAGELQARFMNVNLANSFNYHRGYNHRHIEKIFTAACENSPSVVFFDHLEALDRKRSSLRQDDRLGSKGTAIPQLLRELEGGRGGDVIVLGATAYPWNLDSSLLGSKGFERSLLMSPPDADARRTILAKNLAGHHTEALDLSITAQETAGLSASNLGSLVDKAASSANNKPMMGGLSSPITMDHLAAANDKTTTSFGPWAQLARDFIEIRPDSVFAGGLTEWLGNPDSP